MAEDSTGFVWIGTSGGTLLRINDDAWSPTKRRSIGGDLFEGHPMPCLYTPTPDDNLWIGYAGVGQLGRLKDGKFTHVTPRPGTV